MNIIKKTFSTIGVMLCLSSVAFASEYEISDSSPLVFTGKLMMNEGTSKFWIKTDDPDIFSKVKQLAAHLYYREEYKAFMVESYGIDIDSFKSSTNKEEIKAYGSASRIIKEHFLMRDVSLYCSRMNYSRMPSCLIFRTTDDDKSISYNQILLEGGLAKVKDEYMDENEKSNSMYIYVKKSEKIAKDDRIGIWKDTYSLLPDDF